MRDKWPCASRRARACSTSATRIEGKGSNTLPLPKSAIGLPSVSRALSAMLREFASPVAALADATTSVRPSSSSTAPIAASADVPPGKFRSTTVFACPKLPNSASGVPSSAAPQIGDAKASETMRVRIFAECATSYSLLPQFEPEPFPGIRQKRKRGRTGTAPIPSWTGRKDRARHGQRSETRNLLELDDTTGASSSHPAAKLALNRIAANPGAYFFQGFRWPEARAGGILRAFTFCHQGRPCLPTAPARR
jgi:hypothetical protein